MTTLRHFIAPAKQLAIALMCCLPIAAASQQAGQLPLLIGQGAATTNYSIPIQTLLFFTALSDRKSVV